MGVILLGSLWRPAVALAAVFCMFGLEQWAQSQGGLLVARPTLLNVTVGVIVLCAMGVQTLRGRLRLADFPPVGWVTMALFALAGASYLWTLDRGAFVEEWMKMFPYIVILVGLTPFLVSDWAEARTGLMATLAAGALVLCLLAFHTEWTYRGVAIDAFGRGGMGNPLAVASLGGHIVLIAALMNFTGMARIWQVTRWVVVLLGLYIAVRSGSRGQAVTLLIATVVFLPLSRRIGDRRGMAVTLLGLLVLGGIVLWAQVLWATGGRWEWSRMAEVYSATRLETSITLLSHWLHGGPVHWLIGLGNSASFRPDIIGFYPHIVVAEVLAEEGLIGFVLLCSIPILGFRSVYRCYHIVKDEPVSRGILAALAALFLFELILSFKQGSLLRSQYAFCFVIILGRMEMVLRHQSRAAATWLAAASRDRFPVHPVTSP